MGEIKFNQDSISSQENNEDIGTVEKVAPTELHEDISKRNECEKHYLMSDGTYRAYLYGGAVHYKNEGTDTWDDINNTLIDSPNCGDGEDYDGWQNKCGNFNVKFVKELFGNGYVMKVAKGEHKLIWKLDGENSLCHSNINIIDNKSICDIEAGKVDTMSSEIRYNDFASNADLQYIISNDCIKENIIIKERCNSYDFAFRLSMQNLKLRLSDDSKKIEFLSTLNKINDTEEDKADRIIFTIPAPDMEDANGEKSHDVDYRLDSVGDEEYLLKIIPNIEWINAPDRAFPVAIDPSVYIRGSNHILMENRWRSASGEGNASTNSRTSGTGIWNSIVGGTFREYITYFRLVPISMVGRRITGTQLLLTTGSISPPQVNVRFDIYELPRGTTSLASRTFSSVNNATSTTRSLIFTNVPTSGTRMKFALDNGTTSFNRDIVLRLSGNRNLAAPERSVTFYNNDNHNDVNIRPILVINYIVERGVLSPEQHFTPLGRAGTGMMDLDTGHIRWVHENTALGGLNLPVQTCHIYDINFAATHRNLISFDAIGLGTGWRTNYHQYLIPITRSAQDAAVEDGWRPSHIYIDGMGVEHIFYRTRIVGASGGFTEEFRTQDGHLILSFPMLNAARLEDRNGNSLAFFWQSGIQAFTLMAIENKSGRMLIRSSNGRINSVSDPSDRSATFNYTNNLLTSITSEGNTVNFVYSGQNLTTIRYEDENTTHFTNGLEVVRDQTGHRVEYSIAGNQTTIRENTNISRIWNGGTTPVNPSNTIVGSRPNIVIQRFNFIPPVHSSYTRGDTITTVRVGDNFDRRIRYTFDSTGSPTLIERINRNGVVTQVLSQTTITNSTDTTRIETNTPLGTSIITKNKNANVDIVISDGTNSTTLRTNLRGNIVGEFLQTPSGRFDTHHTINNIGQTETSWDDTQIEQRNFFHNNMDVLSSTHSNRRGVVLPSLSQRFDLHNNTNFLQTITDYSSRSAATTLGFNHSTGRLETISLNANHVISYNYNNVGLVSEVITEIDGRRIRNVYNYRRGCLTRLDIIDILDNSRLVKRFEWDYDGFGRCIGNFELEGNIRRELTTRALRFGGPLLAGDNVRTSPVTITGGTGTDNTGNATVTYHRGDATYTQKTTFDEDGRVLEVTGNGAVELTAEYDDNLLRSIITDSALSDGQNQSTVAISQTSIGTQNQQIQTVAMSGFRSGNILARTDSSQRPHEKFVDFNQAVGGVGGRSETLHTFGYTRANGVTDLGILATMPNSVTLPNQAGQVLYRYDNNGRIDRRTRGAVTETYAYFSRANSLGTNGTSNVQTITYSDGRTTTYSYHSNGNVATSRDAFSNADYEYDSVGRIIRENNSALGVTRRIRYNAMGNVQDIRENILTNIDNPTPQSTVTYNYDTRGRFVGVSIIGTPVTSNWLVSGITHDNIGNPNGYRGETVRWERAGDMSQFGGNFYRYDAVGIRQEKRSGSIDGTLTAIYYTDGGIIHREDRPTVSQSLRYHYSLIGVTGFEWVRIGHPTSNIHLTYNALGDVVGVFENGVLQARYVYDMWGNHRVLNASGVVIFDSRVGVVISGHENNAGVINPWRWRGQYYDVESGFYYVGGRYYDPRLGHVINATLDEAKATGGYMYRSPNPLDIFPGVGNFFAPPTWGYPELYIPEWQQEQSRSGWSWWQNLLFWGGVLLLTLATKGLALALVKGVKGAKIGVKGVKLGSKATKATLAAHGATINFGAGVVHEGFNNGWNDINWGVVGVRTAFGAVSGFGRAMPFGKKGANIAFMGGVGFIQSAMVDIAMGRDINLGMATLMGTLGMGGMAFGCVAAPKIIQALSTSQTVDDLLTAIFLLLNN